MSGYVYLLHLERPISPAHTCQHYIGWCDSLAARLQAHALGNGARLLAVARERGIGWRVVRVWRGGRQLERRLKNWHNAPRLCPVCQARPEGVRAGELTPAEIEDELIAF